MIARRLLFAAGSFIVATMIMSAIGAVWAADMRAPRVTVLGAGRQLSVLVTAGDARLLIATGDDPIAFGNALERARHPTTRRIDVLIVAGSGRELAAAGSVSADARQRFSLGPLGRSAEAEELRPAPLILPAPRIIRLDRDVTVTFETVVPPADSGVAAETLSWRAMISRRATNIAVLSDSAAHAAFTWSDPVAAIVFASGQPDVASIGAQTDAVVVNAEQVSGGELRAVVSSALENPLWAIRVHRGEAARLPLTDDGLSLPSNAQRLTPAAQPTRAAALPAPLWTA